MFIENMFRGGSLWGGIISGGISQIQDTNAMIKGDLDKKEYAIQTTENVSGAFGVMAGVEYGAILGTSVMPGVGTIIGSLMGGLLGDKLGRMVGNQTGTALFNNRIVQKVSEPTLKDNIQEFAVKGKEMILDLTDQIKDAAIGMINQTKVETNDTAVKNVEH
jgi:outer membrane lipoprotein SlyB